MFVCIRAWLRSCVGISLLIATVCLSSASAQSQEWTPEWYGELDIGPRLFRFLLEKQDDKLRLLSIDEAEKRFDLDSITWEEGKFHFELKAARAKYDGVLNGEKIEGKWSQGGAGFPLAFRRVTSRPKDDATEIWRGTLDALSQKLVMQFRLYEKNGQKSAYFDSVSQGAGGFKISTTIEDTNYLFDCAMLKGKFEGKKSEDGQKLEGVWKQGSELPLTLEKQETEASSAVEPLRRPQTPKGPFSYDSEEIKVQVGDIQLVGTLTLPKGKTRVPVAIMVSGSGPQDRDETLFEHKPFFVIADMLAQRGVAVLRFDERGVGASTGEYATATSRDFANDVIGLMGYCGKHPRIDPKQIGIIGHSEGGIIAPMIAAERPEVAWIVMMAGTGVNGEAILKSQSRLIAKAQGVSEKELQQQDLVMKLTMEMVRAAPKDAKPESLKDEFLKKIFEGLEKAGMPLSDEDRKKAEQSSSASLAGLMNPWIRFFLDYDPMLALSKVRCPVLVLNGEKDLQVDADLNLPKIEQGLKQGGNKQYQIHRLKNLNHLFQNCETGSPTEYVQIEETLDAGFLKLMGDWIEERGKR